MDFGPNKISIEVVKEGTFWGAYFRDIYSSGNWKWYIKSWKEFNQLKHIDQKYYCSSYDCSVDKFGVNKYDCSVNKYGSIRIWENKGLINEIEPYGWFQWCFRNRLGRRSDDDERQVALEVN